MTDASELQDYNANDFVVPADVEAAETQKQPQKGSEREIKSFEEDEEPQEIEDDEEDGEESEENDEDSEEEIDTEPKSKPKPDKGRARESYQVRQARREAQEAKKLVQELREQLRQPSGGQSKDAAKIEKPVRPNPNDSKYELKEWDPKYAEDLAKYQDEHDEYVLAKALEKAESASAEASRVASQARAEASFNARADQVGQRGLDKYEDFEETVTDAFEAMPPAPEAAKAILELQNAEDVFYHLGQHPDQLERITAMGPMAQALEFGKLSARLASKASASKKITKSNPTPEQPRGSNGRYAKAGDARYEKFLRNTAG